MQVYFESKYSKQIFGFESTGFDITLYASLQATPNCSINSTPLVVAIHVSGNTGLKSTSDLRNICWIRLRTRFRPSRSRRATGADTGQKRNDATLASLLFSDEKPFRFDFRKKILCRKQHWSPLVFVIVDDAVYDCARQKSLWLI